MHGVSMVGSISRVPTLAPLVFVIGLITSFNVECSSDDAQGVDTNWAEYAEFVSVLRLGSKGSIR